MSRVYNFSAGPAVLPEEVLKEAQEEMLDYRGCGMSVMEMSHRSKVFQNIIDEAEADLRDLMGIPSNYKVLFLQGGASLQFSSSCFSCYFILLENHRSYAGGFPCNRLYLYCSFSYKSAIHMVIRYYFTTLKL